MADIVQGRPLDPSVGAENVLGELAERVASAINQGSQLFNQGRAKDCAAVYFDVVQHCLRKGALPEDCRTVLQKAAQRAERQFKESGAAERPAWVLRSALDYVLNVLSTAQPPRNGGGGCGNNPFLAQGVSPDVRLPSEGQAAGQSYHPGAGGYRPPADYRPVSPCHYGDRPVSPCHYGDCKHGGVAPDNRPMPRPATPSYAAYRPSSAGYAAPSYAAKPSYSAAPAYETRRARVEYAPRGYDDGAASGALLGAAGGLAVGAMLGSADSPGEFFGEGLGALGGAALGGAYGGVGGGVAGGVLGALVGDSLF